MLFFTAHCSTQFMFMSMGLLLFQESNQACQKAQKGSKDKDKDAASVASSSASKKEAAAKAKTTGKNAEDPQMTADDKPKRRRVTGKQ